MSRLTRRNALRLYLVSPFAAVSPGPAQRAPADYAVEGTHPRLLASPRRLRLLRRERERRSMRWLQLQALADSGAELPEPGFAFGICYLAGGGPHYARRAIEWALAGADEPRQLALVWDWCHSNLTTAEAERLAQALRAHLERLRAVPPSVEGVRTRVLAALALADLDPELAAAELRFTVEQWWEGTIIPALRRGETPIGRHDTYALMELLHVVRDQLKMDLRESFKPWFAALPVYHMLTYYPVPYPGPEGDYRIPAPAAEGAPDLKLAALSRAAELSLVAFDPNALETQFVQGWCMLDRFMMRDAFGAPYEFFWANPYHPGLSFHNAPLVLHQPDHGLLVARSSWEEDARWVYHAGGVIEIFAEGKVKRLRTDEFDTPFELGHLIVRRPDGRGRFEAATEEEELAYYLVGLKPKERYEIEVDDEEIFEKRSDAGGILVIEFPPRRRAGVILRPVGRRPAA